MYFSGYGWFFKRSHAQLVKKGYRFDRLRISIYKVKVHKNNLLFMFETSNQISKDIENIVII